MKKWILGIFAAGLLFAAFIAMTPFKPVLYSDTYYGKLKAACTQTEGPACCESSVKTMEAQGYRLAEGTTRPDGYQCSSGQSIDRLKCIGSYRWCVPQENQPTATVTTVNPTTCPQFMPPAPNSCVDGTILPGEVDADGCRGPAQCIRPTEETTPDTAEIADAPVNAVLGKDETIQACGKNIRYSGIARAPGTRSDWLHSFDILKADGTIRESLTAYSTGEHKMASKETGVTVIVQRIEETEPYRAAITIDCGI